MEKETNNALPFLDVKVDKSDGQIKTSVYRKPTHTGQYLNYESNHPGCTKRGIVRTLTDRAKAICNNKETLKGELEINQERSSQNGYSERMVNNILTENRPARPRKTDEKEKTTIYIPYIKGVSEQIRRVGERYNVRTVFKSTTTLRSLLTKTRPEHNTDTKNCIYQVPCECGQSYTGETRRQLETRLKEYRKCTQQGELLTNKFGICFGRNTIMYNGAKLRSSERGNIGTNVNSRKQHTLPKIQMSSVSRAWKYATSGSL